jgi:hypothetical protein
VELFAKPDAEETSLKLISRALDARISIIPIDFVIIEHLSFGFISKSFIGLQDKGNRTILLYKLCKAEVNLRVAKYLYLFQLPTQSL